MSVAFAMHMPFSFRFERNVQLIENQVRTNVGLYLRANVESGQSVTSESRATSGTISGVKLYDYPGLTSKTSVPSPQELAARAPSLVDLVSVFSRTGWWLRPWSRVVQQNYPAVAADYRVEKIFKCRRPESTLDARNASSFLRGLVRPIID